MSDFDSAVEKATRLFGGMSQHDHDIAAIFYSSAIASMQGEAVAEVACITGKWIGVIYQHALASKKVRIGAQLFTYPPSAASKIAEQDARIKELEQQLEVAREDINELGNAYILMRGGLNYMKDKAITGNQADEALASKIPDVMQRFPMKRMSGSWENLMTLFVKPDAAIRQIGGAE